MDSINADTLQRRLSNAVALHQAGQFADAERLYREILTSFPDLADVFYLLGILLRQTGRAEAAVSSLEQALQAGGPHGHYYFELAQAQVATGRVDGAEASLRASLALEPNFPEAHNNLGVLSKQSGALESAEASFRTAVSLKSDYVEARANLGNLLREKGELDAALEQYLEAYQAAPDNTSTLISLGNACKELGRVDEALACYNQVLTLEPESPEAAWNQALVLLLKGELAAGWAGFEWRFKFQNAYPHRYGKPYWGGAPFSGQRLLIYDEIGYGDVFQFLRYLPLVKARGGDVLFECKPGLRRLLEGFPGIDTLLERGQCGVSEQDFDFHLPMESLPGVFGTTLETIPNPGPYLKAPAWLKTQWKSALENVSEFRVGLVWAGNASSQFDRTRSCPATCLRALERVEGVAFFSLQKGGAEMDLHAAAPGLNARLCGEMLKDFADTAALIENLDLVITVETAVAHLAAALGKPTWILLPLVPAWRWLLDRNDSPWYSSVRLFRQQTLGQWEPVLESVADALNATVRA